MEGSVLSRTAIVSLQLAMVLLAGGTQAATPPAKSSEPRITSLDPACGQKGTTYESTVRGVNVANARSLFFPEQGITGKVVSGDTGSVRVAITIAEQTPAGTHPFRLITAEGLSNQILLRVVEEPVVSEHEARGMVAHIPIVIAGRIAQPGESDDYWINVTDGQTLTLEAYAGAGPLDPSVGIYESGGSWFDAHRLNRIAFNDEPLYFPGLAKDARLVHRFRHAGKYCIRVQGFSGQGGADATYELRVTAGDVDRPDFRPAAARYWDERQLVRGVDGNWLSELYRRGGVQLPAARSETYRAVPEGTPDIPVMNVPGIVEGRLRQVSTAHLIHVKIDKPQQLAIEVETPEATKPFFTPIVRLVDSGGTEIVSNVYTRLNNNNLKMMKQVEAKTTIGLQAAGVYTLEVRELTSGQCGENFHYRVMVRPQVPHIGKFWVTQDAVNLERGTVRAVTINTEREEGFSGIVAIHLENLPPGVSVTPGLERPDEKPPLPNAGKFERYEGKLQSTSVLLQADPDAPEMVSPVQVRVVARLLIDGRAGEPVAVTTLPMMVINKRPM